ncbi:MAG: transcription antitermination factor NusB [Longimicrobiales bacterium]
MRARSRARGWSLQILYAWEAREARTGGSIDAVRAEFFRDRLIAEESKEYIRTVLGAVERHLAEINAEVQQAVTNWRLERLSAIDRNILRIGAAELLFLDDLIPPRVAIQEAIHLAEKYGTGESPRFVNGVLDALMRRARSRVPDVD